MSRSTALALGLYGGLLCLLFPHRLHRAFYLLIAGVSALLPDRPAQNGPFLDALASGRVFAGNHALSGTSSFWHHGLVTASTIFALPYRRNHRPRHLVSAKLPRDLEWSPESFQTGYGLMSVLLIAAGLLSACLPSERRRDPLVRLQRLYSALSLAFVAYVVIENLLPRPHSIWPFTFIHLTQIFDADPWHASSF